MKTKSLVVYLLLFAITFGSIFSVAAVEAVEAEGEADPAEETYSYCSDVHSHYSNDYDCSYYNRCAYFKDFYYTNIRSSTGRLIGTGNHHECNHHVMMQCPKFNNDNQCTLSSDPYYY